MGGGGGKGGGGKSTTTVKLPGWAEDAIKTGLASAEEKSKLGYMPYMGPDVAALTPQQVQGMQSASDFASAFGMGPQQDVASQLPQSQEFAGGIQGYSSYPLYQQAQDTWSKAFPGQSDYYKSFFIDPITGAPPTNPTRQPGAGGSGYNPLYPYGSGSGAFAPWAGSYGDTNLFVPADAFNRGAGSSADPIKPIYDYMYKNNLGWQS